ncbi:MAG: hypothetical protein A3F11_06640 [Gammaproteobacteria bacterium RIFCSPHIGHO2_12_FULL_37_14]|nr:MAG: hypothetical protein A3F11_06640 [Gammaproteobacteria bacterium RIFCSPHIGHO2_12_FULL_37_14]
MPEKLIPEHVDPFRYAEQALRLSGVVNIATMSRLSSMISANSGQVVVDFHFGIDEQGITLLKGHLQTELLLQCQRCLEPYNYEIIVDFVLGVASTYDEAKGLPECYEPVLTKEGHLALRELVEDEIILNLPLIPKHERQNCKIALPVTDSEVEEGKVKSPFQVLELLKHKQDK